MLKLNLINPSKSNIQFSISRFPDGEVQISLGEFDRKNNVTIICRISSAEDLFIVAQACDILKRNGVMYGLEITYLMSMRMDRVMDFNRPFSLKIVSDIIKGFGAEWIDILEAHSARTHFELCSNPTDNPVYSIIHEIQTEYVKGLSRVLVYPDAGAKSRYDLNSKFPIVTFCKKRDLETGKIISIEPEDNKDCLLEADEVYIFDDLCDAGGTFVGIANYIRGINKNCKLNILVTHMVNPKGISNLSNNFDHVWFTNSYKDWKEELGTLPINVTQIDVV